MSGFWWRAREAADDANALFRAGRYNNACSRAYYAMFTAARALLIERGHRPETAKRHATVLRLFSLEFVRDGPFDADDGRTLQRAGKTRITADYGEAGVTAEEARQVLASLDRFMNRAEQMIHGEMKAGGKP